MHVERIENNIRYTFLSYNKRVLPNSSDPDKMHFSPNGFERENRNSWIQTEKDLDLTSNTVRPVINGHTRAGKCSGRSSRLGGC